MVKKSIMFVLVIAMVLIASLAFAANEGLYQLGSTTTATTLKSTPGTVKDILITSSSSTTGYVTIKDGSTTKAIIHVTSSAPIAKSVNWRFFTSLVIEYSSTAIDGTFQYEP